MHLVTRRRQAAATLLGAVLLAHALLLWLLGATADDDDADLRPAAARSALQTRQVVVPVAAAAAQPPQPAAAPPTVQRTTTRPAARSAAAPTAVVVAASESAPPMPAERDADPDPALPLANAADTRDPPVYATRLPSSAHLRYRLQRGAASGTAELRWTLADGRYQLQIDGNAGSPLLAWDSSGSIDAAGVAPDRFVDRRRRRGAMAVNFQRDRGLITFSGPQLEVPLRPGAQDRASWLLQLAAVVAADPARFGAVGERIELFVAGARGDAEAWVFSVEGSAALDLPAGPVPAALHLLREPRRPYDTRAEVWLDPARQHLPVRVRLQHVPGPGDATDWLLLQDMAAAAPP